MLSQMVNDSKDKTKNKFNVLENLYIRVIEQVKKVELHKFLRTSSVFS